MIIGALFQIVSGKLKLRLRKLDWLLLVFAALSVVYFFISILFLNSDTALSFSSAKNYAFYSLFYFVTYLLINSKKRFRDLLTVVIGSGAAILWFVFYGITVRHGLWSDFTPLSTEGVRTLAFTHGYYLCMALIGAFVYVAYQKDLFSKWLLILMPFWVIGIIGSMMRHLWISISLTFAFLIVLFARTQLKSLKEHAKTYSIIGLMLLVIAFYGASLFPRSSMYASMSNGFGMIGSRVTSITNTDDESFVWRGTVWQESAKEFAKDPIFGIGFGKKVSVEIGTYHDFVEVRNMHNSFLVILVQMGILGFVLFATLIGILGWKVLRYKFKDQVMQMGAYIVLGILVFQLAAFMFQPYLEANLLGIFFWINLGMLRRIYENIIE